MKNKAFVSLFLIVFGCVLGLTLAAALCRHRSTTQVGGNEVFSPRKMLELCGSRCVLPSIKEAVPVVGVIIPTFKRPRSCLLALKSVLSQTYSNVNIRVVVVDDGSPDFDSYSDVRTLCRENPGFDYVSLPINGGQSQARNVGLMHLKNSYEGVDFFCFLDDDDAFLPEKLAVQIPWMISRNADLCCSDGIKGAGYFDPVKYRDWSGATYNTSGHAFKIIQSRFGKGGIPRMFKEDDLRKHNFIVTSSVCVKRASLSKTSGFNPNLKMAEDFDLWLQILKKSGVGIYLSTPLFYYDSAHAGGSFWGYRKQA